MSRISLETDILPLSDFRANFTGYINQVHSTKRPLVITQHGRSAAVLVNVSEYERMLDKFELIQDIEAATKQLDDGEVLTHARVKSKLKKRFSV